MVKLTEALGQHMTLWQALMIYGLAMFAGAVGGLVVGANRQLRARGLILFQGIALTVAGAAAGLLCAVYLLSGYSFLGIQAESIHQLTLWSLISGFVGALVFGGLNLSAGMVATFVLRRLGFDIQISVRESRDKKD